MPPAAVLAGFSLIFFFGERSFFSESPGTGDAETRFSGFFPCGVLDFDMTGDILLKHFIRIFFYLENEHQI